MDSCIFRMFKIAGLLCMSVFLMQCSDFEDWIKIIVSRDTDSDVDTGSEVDTETAESPMAMLIDDFEDGDHLSLLGGQWFTYTDGDNGGASSIFVTANADGNVVMDGQGYESVASMAVSYAFDQGDYEWNPYVGWGVTCGDAVTPMDASMFGGIAYMYKGSAHVVGVQTANVTDYDFYLTSVEASDDWRLAVIPFSYFAQGGWGQQQPFDLTRVVGVYFQANGQTGETGAIQIDNLGFAKAGTVVAEKDLVIYEPEVPEKNIISDLTIANPLQQQAMMSLTHGANITNWLEQGAFESWEYGEDYVNTLAQNGFKGLRLPIDLDLYIVNRAEYLAGNAPFEVDPQLFEILDNFDAWTAAAGLSLTIDYHQYDASLDFADPQFVAGVVELWRAVAEHFALNPRKDLFFELANEVEQSAGVGSVDADVLTAFAQNLIDAIRSVNTSHTILFGDVQWYSHYELINREPFADNNIIYVFHFYEPFEFTHQGANWTGQESTHGIPWPYSPLRWSEYSADLGYNNTMEQWHFDGLSRYHQEANANWLYNSMIDVKQWAIENDVAVICNEFGAYDRTSLKEDRVRYYTDLVAAFEDLEIPWQIWFTVMDQDTGEMDSDIKAALRL
ncbi:MAG: cellulase family glycosylhydrolase [Deltaproteobacteria bacterium]|nr:cellulase family glycosylhydrolase [Deltaproteobacteria bacterium]